MQSVTLQGTVRTELGTKYAKQLRDQGHVPCVIYGGKAPIHFYAPMLAFRDLVYTAEARMASIELDGKTYNAVIQDIPIVLTGNSRGVRSGGKLKSALRNLKVKGLIDALPSSIEHDITELRIGQAIRVSDIKVGKIYEILNSDNAVVVSISSSRTSVADTNDDDEAAVEEAPAAEASAE